MRSRPVADSYFLKQIVANLGDLWETICWGISGTRVDRIEIAMVELLLATHRSCMCLTQSVLLVFEIVFVEIVLAF